jgi:TM2 domain-containing membrane protein YozV
MEEKETFWAYMFLFFLGTLGVHKFYLGNTFMGFVYMFTAGLLGFGLFYDIFTLPFQVASANKNITISPAAASGSCCNNCSC